MTLNEYSLFHKRDVDPFGLTVRTSVIGDLYYCYALASADGTNISIIQNGRNLRGRVPIDAPRMGVPFAARDILFILHPTWHSYTYGWIYTINRYHEIPMNLYGLHIYTHASSRYSLMKLFYLSNTGTPLILGTSRRVVHLAASTKGATCSEILKPLIAGHIHGMTYRESGGGMFILAMYLGELLTVDHSWAVRQAHGYYLEGVRDPE
jgi:hypothetical protein